MAKFNLNMTDDEILALQVYVQTGNNGMADSPQRQHCRSAIKKLNEAVNVINSEREFDATHGDWRSRHISNCDSVKKHPTAPCTCPPHVTSNPLNEGLPEKSSNDSLAARIKRGGGAHNG